MRRYLVLFIALAITAILGACGEDIEEKYCERLEECDVMTLNTCKGAMKTVQNDIDKYCDDKSALREVREELLECFAEQSCDDLIQFAQDAQKGVSAPPKECKDKLDSFNKKAEKECSIE